MEPTAAVPEIRTLRGAVHGPVLLPGSPGYDDARALWNARPDRHPGAIVRCRDTDDVVAAVRYARTHGLLVSIRGGGHHVTGDAVCDDGLMIDLSEMKVVQVDPEARTARVGAGARARDLNDATQPHGLATTAAPIVSCGMAGYTLGGGLGWISRKYGLACDNLLSAEVVTAEGRVVRASDDENRELFWALRGGGGNFGVVTSFEYRLHEVGPRVLSGQIVHWMENAAAVLRFYRDYMPTAPDELACMPVVYALPPVSGVPAERAGETVFALVPFYDGDFDEGMEVIRPLRQVGEPVIDEVGPAVYANLLADLERAMYGPGDRNSYDTAFFDELPDAAIEAFVAHAAPVPSAFSSIFLEWLGGAAGRVDHDATAYPHRARRMCLTAVPKWEDPARDAEMIGWAERVFEALEPYAAPGKYVNYLDRRGGPDAGDTAGDAASGPSESSVDAAAETARVRGEEGAVRAAYGDHYERLARIKGTWDPDNLFRVNHNIRPAT